MDRIVAKWAGKCAATGRPFAAGATVMHDPSTKRCYLPGNEPVAAEGARDAGRAAARRLRAGEIVECPHAAGSPSAAEWHAGVDEALLGLPAKVEADPA